MVKILVVDYECGNLGCIRNALEYLDYQVDVVHVSLLNEVDPASSCVILPGVGNYGFAINKIQSYMSLSSLKNWLLATNKLMCICLGFQLLFHASHETSSDGAEGTVDPMSVDGLSLFSSTVLPLGSNSSPSLNVGWRRTYQAVNNSTNYSPSCFEHIASHSFYHMHSYGIPVDMNTDQLQSYDWYITSRHMVSNVEFVTAFLYKNIIGLQFHPEKSGEYGLSLIKNFFA